MVGSLPTFGQKLRPENAEEKFAKGRLLRRLLSKPVLWNVRVCSALFGVVRACSTMFRVPVLRLFYACFIQGFGWNITEHYCCLVVGVGGFLLHFGAIFETCSLGCRESQGM